jgi:hypothetical protein
MPSLTDFELLMSPIASPLLKATICNYYAVKGAFQIDPTNAYLKQKFLEASLAYRTALASAFDEMLPPANDGSCITCCDKSANTELLPCNHKVMCSECATKVLLVKPCCPMCRATVKNTQSDFMISDYLN